MNILVLGQSVVDEIEEDDKISTKPGGIFYSILGLSQIINENDEIYLLTNYSEKYYKLFSSAFSKVNMILSTEVQDIPTVKLKILKNKERTENYSFVKQRLTIKREINFNDFDGILVNMISGFDITVYNLEFIRRHYKGLIYFDVHSLARGIDNNGDRNFRPIKNITKWLNSIDIIQCNENELLTIYNSKNEKDIADFVLSQGPRIFIITKGNKGAKVYYKSNVNINQFEVKPINVSGKNKVGCGDVFGASFFYYYLLKNDIYFSLQTANIYAGLFTQYSTINEFQKLRKDFSNYNA